MKFLAAILLVSIAFAQPRWENAAWMTGAVVAFSAVDVIAFNALRLNDSQNVVGYRIAQYILQAGLTYFLYEKCGLPTVIGFNLCIGSFVNDLMYYGFYALHDKRVFAELDNCTWANTTFVGLAQGKIGTQERIPRNTIIAQALVGFSAALTISITL